MSYSFYNHRLSGFFFGQKYQIEIAKFGKLSPPQNMALFSKILTKKNNLTACDCKKKHSFYNHRLSGFFFGQKYQIEIAKFGTLSPPQNMALFSKILTKKKNLTACDCKKKHSFYNHRLSGFFWSKNIKFR